MIFELETYYINQDKHGNAIACLRVYLETANIDFRDRIIEAIQKALATPEPEKKEKSSAIGFDTSE